MCISGIADSSIEDNTYVLSRAWEDITSSVPKMSDWKLVHLTIVAKMVRAKVTGQHHKQKDTIRRWCSSIDGDVISEAIDELCTDPEAPLYEKGRGTITLTSIQDGKKFLEEHDEEEEFVWYL